MMAKNKDELIVMAGVFVAASLNQWMLVHAVAKMTDSAIGKDIGSKKMIPILFIGKAIVLIVALTFGVQIMGKRIIIPLLIYVLQIVVLYLSFKKPKSEQDFKSE